MQDYEVLPDKRLAGLVYCYFWYELPLDTMHVNLNNILAFNFAGTRLTIDGRAAKGDAIYSSFRDPSLVPYAKDAGPILAVRLLPGAFDRLLHVDPRECLGVTALQPKHKRIVELRDRLHAAAQGRVTQLRTLDEALVEFAGDLRPAGLAGAYFDYLREHRGDVVISEAANALETNSRALERACAARFAMTPKRLARSVRAGAMIARDIAEGGRPELHPEFPYADLPHYLNELRKLSGLSRSANLEQYHIDVGRGVTWIFSDGREVASPEEAEAFLAERDGRSDRATARRQRPDGD